MSLLEQLLITEEDINFLEQQEGLIFDPERREILKTLRSIDVQACPGSGKTTLIAAKLILLAKKWTKKYQGICVLSHTNVAKDEIIYRLKASKCREAQRLLSYPHFIGTIQEFVNKFLGIPLIKSWGIEIGAIDTSRCVGLLYSKLDQGTKIYLGQKKYLDLDKFEVKSVLPLQQQTDEQAFKFNTPSEFPKNTETPSYKDLLAKKHIVMLVYGYFTYKELYVFANHLLKEQIDLSRVLQNRFPIIFLDEMQDTEKFQDDLIQTVFPFGNTNLVIQRFGDPDQAIFSNSEEEGEKVGFNCKTVAEMDFVIDKSHRFGWDVVQKIKNLSFNAVSLKSEPSHAKQAPFQHTIFAYDDSQINQVVLKFAELVSQQFSSEHMCKSDFTVKVVGAVGKKSDPEKPKDLKIDTYCPSFDKTKSSQGYKADSLIECVHHCRGLGARDLAESYKYLNECVLSILRKCDKKTDDNRFYTPTTLKTFLIGNGHWKSYRELLFKLLKPEEPINATTWKQTVEKELIKCLEISNLPEELTQYMSFSENPNKVDIEETISSELVFLGNNTFSYRDAFKIELNTIHGVKGETHDAILVLSTKNHAVDIDSMLAFLTGDKPNVNEPNSILRLRPHAKKPENQQFMRQLYVATSRPKHLLCLAINKFSLNRENMNKLRRLGWRIEELPPNRNIEESSLENLSETMFLPFTR